MKKSKLSLEKFRITRLSASQTRGGKCVEDGGTQTEDKKNKCIATSSVILGG